MSKAVTSTVLYISFFYQVKEINFNSHLHNCHILIFHIHIHKKLNVTRCEKRKLIAYFIVLQETRNMNLR